MNTLRAKIAVLLVVAIVSVVGIITWVMLAMLGPPSPERTTEPLADQVEMFLRVAKQDTSGLTLVPEASPGDLRENATSRLRAELAARGHELPVTITRKDWNAPLVVSIPIGGKGWLHMPISDLPPQRKPWYGLLKWLALITVGVTAIAVFAAHRMVQPLVLLENAVQSVGPDAILPHLPERGPAEVRATARALNSLSSRLRKAIESRMRLLAAAGHDLRTPITRMRLRAEFVEDDEERSLWLSDLDELERIADSAILLGARGVGQGGAGDGVARPARRRYRRRAQGSESRRDRHRGSAGERAGEPARPCPRAAQSHDQCRNPWTSRQRQGRGERRGRRRQGAGDHRG